ncbi:sigma-70 family RNA polymerase sigma factor [Nodosilinea sp. LEGE 07088]|uniref:sigma-70 family RNA polymerase sigma factor n=1 Tax=Nodosilinea sp. LEGE 07088 TaxID=2777968 RepID=UPI0018826C4B|nr:sigma-70 family RNA polymerase sigma factor [Nodosilinea sp. LEGE 07088]MBE9138420.1 sigma-70 family RNA polymerase sigma factor [Nodosilinea sp. LEGE 07088]
MSKTDQKNQQKLAQIEIFVDEFMLSVSDLLTPDEFKGTALYKFLLQFSKQWYVAPVDLDDVMLEAVKRGLEHIQTHGQPIKTPAAWLRHVGLNILRDQVDATVKADRKSAMLSDLVRPARERLAEAELIKQLGYLQKALDRLSPDDQAILRMKFLQGKPYEQIRQHYTLRSQAAPALSIPALRKRESRALQRLRRVLLELDQA